MTELKLFKLKVPRNLDMSIAIQQQLFKLGYEWITHGKAALTLNIDAILHDGSAPPFLSFHIEDEYHQTFDDIDLPEILASELWSQSND